MHDQGVEYFPGPGGVGDKTVGWILLDVEGVHAVRALNVSRVPAFVAVFFQGRRQIPITGARLIEAGFVQKVRQQGQNG